ncbi:hypothetical protein [Methylocystis rosea]|uniref:Uncharacterized protein n=1 Tax=Methylocystis rosea TaxID=173366 RepID=A0A3G8MAZ4_9HYPH|nr:hypothetical protein [Methylocystis rosea]AZG78362.1 hypothetical protein EHO51_17395 [Methylocystis rosea]
MRRYQDGIFLSFFKSKFPSEQSSKWAGSVNIRPPSPTSCLQVQPAHEGVNEADRVVGGDVTSIASGKSSNCERSEPGMCVMPDSTMTLTPGETLS